MNVSVGLHLSLIENGQTLVGLFPASIKRYEQTQERLENPSKPAVYCSIWTARSNEDELQGALGSRVYQN